MKRYYQNLSNEPMKYRTWLLVQDAIDESDFKWLKAFDIPIRIDNPTQAFSTVNDGIWLLADKPAYTVDTTTDKQRDMIVLKYGNSAVLIQESVVLPGTVSSLEW